MAIANPIPRRCYIDLSTPAEMACRNAVGAIEIMGADVRLTEAQNLIHKARELVANVVDERLLARSKGE